MTNDIDTGNSERSIYIERVTIATFLALFGLLGILDVYEDWVEQVSTSHIVWESMTNILALGAAAWLYLKIVRSKRKSIQELRLQVFEAQRAADINTALIAKYRDGISATISSQFKLWKLTAAEEEICLFVIKGFSLNEIAALRQTSERTIRHQASLLYKKSGLSGRAQLSAFFLEDLLSSSSEISRGNRVQSDHLEKRAS